MPRKTRCDRGQSAPPIASPTRSRCLSAVAILLAWLICIVLGRLGAPDGAARRPPPVKTASITLQQRG